MTHKKGVRLYHRCGLCGQQILEDHWFGKGHHGRAYDHLNCKNPTVHPDEEDAQQSVESDGGNGSAQLKAECKDCGLPYESFLLDVTLPDEQWLAIHPSGKDGLLCARCIVARASKLSNIIAVRAVFDLG